MTVITRANLFIQQYRPLPRLFAPSLHYTSTEQSPATCTLWNPETWQQPFHRKSRWPVARKPARLSVTTDKHAGTGDGCTTVHGILTIHLQCTCHAGTAPMLSCMTSAALQRSCTWCINMTGGRVATWQSVCRYHMKSPLINTSRCCVDSLGVSWQL